ncbi:MAG: DCC1-like thiol-disulfide oxidoreductase family protein [Luteolibacter sp.]
MKTFSAWQFTFFRILFGSYLTIHFAHLIPYANELFGHEGILGNPALNPAHSIFPNPLALSIPAAGVTAIVAGLAGLSLLFTLGWMRPGISVILWFGWTALFHRNNLIANPSIPYIGLLLLLCALVPTGEPLSLSRPRNETPWFMPKWVFRCAWILLAAGYTFSGYTKLFSPSWIDGSAMSHLLHNPLARPGFMRDIMLALPSGFLALMTWSTLLAELAFLPLSLWKRTRPWIWLALVAMHLGIMFAVNFADLSIGMLMIHFFTFDPDWLPAGKSSKASEKTVTLAYDGECLMCSRFIRFLAAEDRGKRIRFTTLQASGVREITSMHVTCEGKTLTESAAFLTLLDALGGHWRVLAFSGRLVPKPIRNRIYQFIAARRYRWFGKNPSCDLPPRELLERIE